MGEGRAPAGYAQDHGQAAFHEVEKCRFQRLVLTDWLWPNGSALIVFVASVSLSSCSFTHIYYTHYLPLSCFNSLLASVCAYAYLPLYRSLKYHLLALL